MFIMETFECSRCGKVFEQKYNYDRHMKRKNLCKTEIYARNECEYCHRSFSRSDALMRHIDCYCEVKNTSIQLLKNTLVEHEKLILELTKRVEQLEIENREYRLKQTNAQNGNNNSNTNNTNNINNINSNNTYNIKLLAFGKEDRTSITDAVCEEILKKGYDSVPALVEKIHFDEDKPENHNVYISNMNNDFAIIYDGEDWKVSNRDNIVDELYNKNACFLVSEYPKFKHIDKIVSNFGNFPAHYQNRLVRQDAKNDLVFILYNNRKIVEATRKLSEKH